MGRANCHSLPGARYPIVGKTATRRDHLESASATRDGFFSPGVSAAVAVVSLGTILHFALIGVPALSASAEVDRFDLGASGYLGVPSRCVLFGLPLLALVTGAAKEHVSDRVLYVVWGLFIVSRLALGFKGGLLEVAIVLLTVLMVRGRLTRIRHVMLVLGVAVSAVGYAVLVGSQYETLSRGGGVTLGYVVQRMTVIAAEPGWYLLTVWNRAAPGESSLMHDLGYFGQRYFGIGDGPSFATDQLISSIITGTPRAGDSFLVPVTTGGPSYLITSVGPIAATIGLIVIGVIWTRVTIRLEVPTGFLSAAVAATILLALRTFLLNGGGAYLLINSTMGLLLVLAPYAVPTLAHHLVARKTDDALVQ